MIYRVPQQTSSLSAVKHNRQQSGDSESSIGFTREGLNATQSDSKYSLVHQPQSLHEKNKLSYEVSTDSEPFEEIVIRAETIFPRLTNIVGSPTNYLIENPYQTPNVSLSSSHFQRKPSTVVCDASLFSNSQFRRQKNLQETTPNLTTMHSFGGGQSIMQCNGYYPNQAPHSQPPPPPPPPPSQFNRPYSEDDYEERTTYDRRNFQAALQHFEQRSLINNTEAKKLNFSTNPEKRMLNTRPTSIVQHISNHAATMAAPSVPPNASLSSAIVRSGQIFSGNGCGCGPGSGCGNLPTEPMLQKSEKLADVEAIQQYLVAEEPGPGGIKKVFNFPLGQEPGDLTLLRAAVSANRPMDAFIPEENDDVETQLDQQLQQACPTSEEVKQYHNQQYQQQQKSSYHASNQPQWVMQPTCGRAPPVPHSSNMYTGNPVSSQPMPARQIDQGYGTQVEGLENALSALMFNGINNFAAPRKNAAGQLEQQSGQTVNPCNCSSVPRAFQAHGFQSPVGMSGQIPRQTTYDWPQINNHNYDPAQPYIRTTYSSSRFQNLSGDNLTQQNFGHFQPQGTRFLI